MGTWQEVAVLDVDRSLAHGLDAGRRERAGAAARARILAARKGAWHPDPPSDGGNGHLGLLVLDGKLLKSTSVGIASCSELLGEGDLLRPYDEAGRAESVPFVTRWEVIEPVTFAVLDHDFAGRIAQWPEVVSALFARTAQRSHHQALHFTATQLKRLEERLYVLLWHMADRWGHVTADGVRLPVDLTHAQLARLIGATRPAVTTKLGELNDAGVAVRCRNGPGWLLRGPPL